MEHLLYNDPKHSGITNAQSGGGALAAPLQMIDLFFTENGLSIEKDPEYFTYTDDDLTAAVLLLK